jgi:hypothetical protein
MTMIPQYQNISSLLSSFFQWEKTTIHAKQASSVHSTEQIPGFSENNFINCKYVLNCPFMTPANAPLIHTDLVLAFFGIVPSSGSSTPRFKTY